MKELTPEENLKVFHALNHPIRLKILAFIYDRCKEQEIGEAMNSLFPSSASSQIETLKDGGT